jgi:hypothetical protein
VTVCRACAVAIQGISLMIRLDSRLSLVAGLLGVGQGFPREGWAPT